MKQSETHKQVICTHEQVICKGCGCYSKWVKVDINENRLDEMEKSAITLGTIMFMPAEAYSLVRLARLGLLAKKNVISALENSQKEKL